MQSDEVRAFKNELSNYDYYRKRVEALNELIEICYHSLSGLHSPDFQNIPVHSPADLEKRDRLYAEIDKHRANLEKATRKIDEIEEVLNKMPRKIRIATYRVYVLRETVEKVARENHYSKKGMWYWINKEIQNAIQRVEADISTFSLWEERKITTKEAAKRIAESNCFRLLNEEDFTEMANGLGYFRGE